MSKPVNRFDVQVVFPDIAFGITNRKDVELTPEQVADELEEFCRRIRNGGMVSTGRGERRTSGRRDEKTRGATSRDADGRRKAT